MNGLSVAKQPARSRQSTLFLAARLALSVAACWRAFSPQSAMAPNFTLIDEDGTSFTLSALRGHPVALFFGYTHCPDECPTTLARLAKAVHSPNVPSDVRVAFITVDRDSPSSLKHYVRLFDSGFIGLTGSLQSLSLVCIAYHTARQTDRVGHERSDYFITHGTMVYYVGRDGSIKGFGQWDDAVAEIARDVDTVQLYNLERQSSVSNRSVKGTFDNPSTASRFDVLIGTCETVVLDQGARKARSTSSGVRFESSRV